MTEPYRRHGRHGRRARRHGAPATAAPILAVALAPLPVGCGAGANGSNATIAIEPRDTIAAPLSDAAPEAAGTRASAAAAAEASMAALVTLDPAVATRRGEIAIEVGEDAVSFLLRLALADAEHDIGIVRVTGPDGAVLHETSFEDDSWNARRFASAIATEPVVGTGEIALYLPTSPRRPLAAGVYRIAFETDPPGAKLARTDVLLGRAPADPPIDAMPHAIDIHLWVAHPDEGIRDPARRRALEARWRAEIDAMLAPHALAVGELALTLADPAATRRFAELDDDAEIAAACRAARRARPATLTPEDAPLHVALVAEIVGLEHEDWTSGLAPQPGVVHDDASPNACVFVAERGAVAEEPLALDDRVLVATMMANLVHELGHFAGLMHTTEANGTTFDLLDDTPRCSLAVRDGRVRGFSDTPDGFVDEFECDVAGGATNVMFWSGGVEFLPYSLTPEQAWVLRRHPLFRRVPESARAPDGSGASSAD